MILPTDWFRVFADLKDRGWSLSAISIVTGTPVQTLDGYRNAGSIPKHHVGEALVMLWCGATGSTRDRLPHVEKTSGKPERV